MLDETNDAYDIYVDPITSSAGQYLSRRPYVYGLIREVLAKRELLGERVIIEQNMGRNIGTTDIVSTTDDDTIYYARALKSKVYSRFAKNRYPQASKTLTVVIQRDTDGNYEISDTWIGGNHPAFPGDELATPDSESYWKTHALVQDAHVIQSKTLTRTCPY